MTESLPASRQSGGAIECDGGPCCQAAEHIEGCFAPLAQQANRERTEVESLREQLAAAVHRGDWFRQAWANYAHCSVAEAERAFETLGDITTERGQ